MPGNSLVLFIIDDDSAAMHSLKNFVERKYPGIEVATFGSGESALVELHRKPDVIVLDYHLKNEKEELNGIEILKRIKDLLPHTPIIFMSDDDHENVAANIVKYGAYDYIVRGSGAYQRLEIMINNATGHLSLHRQIRVQRIFNIVFILLLFIAFAAIFLDRYF
ncbi:MAG: response regulator [Chitinophagales bacterium]|nr:response regulator [Chitinophagales bacterium]